MTTMDERDPDNATDLDEEIFAAETPGDEAAIEADDSAQAQRLETARKKAIVANAELRDVEKSNDALAQENERLLRISSGMENEDPELVERWRANMKDKPYDK